MSTKVEIAIANFMNQQVSFMQSMDEKGQNPLRIWSKLLSKPKLDEDGNQVLDENNKPARELICDRNGEVIDDSSYILTTSKELAEKFQKLAKGLSDTKQYCQIELLDPLQATMNESAIESLALKGELKYQKFNLIKAAYNEDRKTWEIFTVKMKVVKSLSFSSCYRTVETPVNADDDIDI